MDAQFSTFIHKFDLPKYDTNVQSEVNELQ